MEQLTARELINGFNAFCEKEKVWGCSVRYEFEKKILPFEKKTNPFISYVRKDYGLVLWANESLNIEIIELSINCAEIQSSSPLWVKDTKGREYPIMRHDEQYKIDGETVIVKL